MAIQRYTQIMIVDTFASLPTVAQDGDIAYCQDVKLSFLYSASNSGWNPSNRQVVKKSGITVDGKTTGATTIYTLEAAGGFNFYPFAIVPRAVSITGSGTPPTISVGTNATSYNDIATGAVLTTALATLGAGNGVPQMASFAPGLAAATVIKANVTTAATLFTTYQVKYDILGFYDV